MSEREQVRVNVAAAAARSWTSEQMIERLREQGYLVALRHFHPRPDPGHRMEDRCSAASGRVEGTRWYTGEDHRRELSGRD